ncbi:MAG: adenylate/guanylate cyclase domain-containing protein [Alphaproteobacteria bacterium]|nr:adenylate/guanylate cyclase domain-containing protein [Alphaproteobacteria bacterium]
MGKLTKALKWAGGLPLYALVICVLLSLMVALRIADPAAIAQLRMAAFDTFQRMAPRKADPSFPVKVVAIDEASLKALGQWPWPRDVLADLIDRLNRAGAKVIALDLVFPEADRLSPKAFLRAYKGEPGVADVAAKIAGLPTLDERLSEALENAPSVVAFAGEDRAASHPGPVRASFAKAGDAPEQFVPTYAASVATLPQITEKARGLGAVNWIPERDQIVRRVPLLVTVAGELYPSLAVESLRIGQGVATIAIKSSGASGLDAFGKASGVEIVRVGTAVLQSNKRAELWLRFAPSDPRRTISAHKVLANDFDASLVNGKYIFIGASAIGLLDLRATALADLVPGVELHAQALEQMLSGDYVLRPAYALGLELAFLCLAGWLIAWALGRSGPITAAVVGAGAIAGVVGSSYLAYTSGGLLFDPVYPSLALVLVYGAGSLTNFVRAENERRQVRFAFSSYLAPELVEELVAHPDKLKLGGENRVVTLLFADVRNFTTLAEGLDAETLVAFVNRLFTPLSEAILTEKGTIDKFMGDAVMAFWNAPIAQPRHAKRACRAALLMLSELQRLNAELEREAKEADRDFKPVRIGVGLNTGECCVGNVGSPERFDYSVLGDVVNIASRLESLTKTYGASIIAGASTVEAAADFAFLEIDTVILRGRTQRQPIYALLGDETMAASPPFQALKPLHEDLRASLSVGDRERAAKAISACRRIDIPAYHGVLDYYAALASQNGN